MKLKKVPGMTFLIFQNQKSKDCQFQILNFKMIKIWMQLSCQKYQGRI